MIYFIVTDDLQFMKVGYSKAPEERLKALQTGCPLPLKILHTVPGTKNLEKKLHMEFASS